MGIVVPDLPGCFSAGDLLDEAYAMARKAIELWIKLWINMARGDAQPIPRAAPWERYMADPAFNGWAWGVVEVNMGDLGDTVERIHIAVPRRVARRIDRYVEQRHATRSGFLSRATLLERLK
jgi:predicted RNase H-like HicB family nuclease